VRTRKSLDIKIFAGKLAAEIGKYKYELNDKQEKTKADRDH